MADRQPLAHRVFAAKDVHVGATDRRGRDPQERIEWPDFRDRLNSRAIRPGSTNTAAFICGISRPFPWIRRRLGPPWWLPIDLHQALSIQRVA
jgi:hypothetical protein